MSNALLDGWQSLQQRAGADAKRRKTRSQAKVFKAVSRVLEMLGNKDSGWYTTNVPYNDLGHAGRTFLSQYHITIAQDANGMAIARVE
jgi:hypothetical protein